MNLISRFFKRNDPVRALRFAYTFVALILSVWVVFYPRPYYWAIGAAFVFVPTLAGGALIRSDLFSLEMPDRTDGRTVNLFNPCVFVSLALILRLMSDLQITNELRLLLLTIPLGIVFAWIGWIVIEKSNFWAVVIVAVMYAGPVIVQVNGLGPSSIETVVDGLVSRKYSSIKPVAHTIVLRSEEAEVHVRIGKEAYSNFDLGDRACAQEVKGWLGIAIRSPIPCDGL